MSKKPRRRKKDPRTSGSTSPRHPQSSFITFRRSIVPFLIDDARRRIFVTSFPVVIPRDVSLRQTKSACDFRYHDFRMVDHLRASAGRSLNHHKLNDINTPGKIHERLTNKSMHKWFTSHMLKIISRCFYFANDFSRPDTSIISVPRARMDKKKTVPEKKKNFSSMIVKCKTGLDVYEASHVFFELRWLGSLNVGSLLMVFDDREVNLL